MMLELLQVVVVVRQRRLHTVKLARLVQWQLCGRVVLKPVTVVAAALVSALSVRFA